MNRYLLEVGTEELPAGFLQTAPEELTQKTEAALEAARLTLADTRVTCYYTPRRLALVIDNLPDLQPNQDVVMKGPPVRIALDKDGKPTPAALGFAKKAGIDVVQMKQESIDGEACLVFRQNVAGQPLQKLLPDLLPDLILGLSGSHFMRWANHEVRFSRPVRWIVSIWNNQHLPLNIGPVSSGTQSQGHRILSAGPVEIPSVDQYLTVLQDKGAVMADQHKRKAMIREQLQQTAQQMKAKIKDNDDLLETVASLVEYPSVVVGQFKEKFLAVPDEVTTTVMIAHQKYFPVHQTSDDHLLPHFVTISNGKPESADIIRSGNEKVITARLEDASFFFAEDQKIPLENRLEKLKGITFQKGLGSMYEKACRLETLAVWVADQLGAKDTKQIQRAARLAKADLATGMVFEFTELQGVMGQKYAALQGEPEAVSTAIYEHYLPRYTGDEVARTPAGIAVSLADKIDTLVCVFSQENAKLPTGSKDPMGLRRMAAGIIQTIIQNQLAFNLSAALEHACKTLGSMATADRHTSLTLLREFILQRLKVLLLGQNNRHDFIDAIFDIPTTVQDPLANLNGALARLEALKKLATNETELKIIVEPANRMGKILGSQFDTRVTEKSVQPTLLKDNTEEALLAAFKQLPALNTEKPDYQTWIQGMSTLSPSVAAFFEAVLVNDPDEQVKKNRYNLLSLVCGYYLRFADFSRLVLS